MVHFMEKAFKLTLLSILVVVMLITHVISGESNKKINTNWLGVAIKGYDPVAYFSEGRAVKGKKEFEYKWEDARWRFASAAHRDLFAAKPERYAPQYGGF